MTRMSWLVRRILAVLVPVTVGAVGLGALPAVAGPLSSVSGVSVSISPPSAAAGALTTYVVHLKTSASGALSGNAGGAITVKLPPGTGLSALADSPVTVAGNQVGDCFMQATAVVTCDIDGGDKVAAGAAVTVTLFGVTNPATAKAYTLTVSTTADTTAVTSPSYTVTGAKGVSSPSVAISPPSAAAGALTTYSLGFATSSTGGLSGDAGSAITVKLPAGTGLSALADSPVTVAGNHVGDCSVQATAVVTCGVDFGDTIAPGTAVTVTLSGVTNPATAKAYTLAVSTTSDTKAVTSPSYAVTSATKIRVLSVKPGNTLTGAKNVTYTVQFTTATGLAGDAGSAITMRLPSGTGLSALGDSPVTVAGNHVGDCSMQAATVVSCGIIPGDTIAAGAKVVASLTGVTNPKATQAYKLKVSTSSDVAASSSSYCIAASGVPCIARLAPVSGPAGATVTITGINLAGATAVGFNGTAAAISADQATKVITTVPAGATSGSVTVMTPGGTATSPSPFTVT